MTGNPIVDALLRNSMSLVASDFFEDINPREMKLPISVPYNAYVKEDKTNVIEIALAGYSKEDISVEVEDSMLVIKVNKKASDDELSFVHKGITSKDLEFTLKIVNGYDAENISPSYKQGILKIEIPKAEGTVKKFKL